MEVGGRGNPGLPLWKRVGGVSVWQQRPQGTALLRGRGDQITQGCSLVTANSPGHPGGAARLLSCNGGHGGFMQKSCEPAMAALPAAQGKGQVSGQWGACETLGIPQWSERTWPLPPVPPWAKKHKPNVHARVYTSTYTCTAGEGRRAGPTQWGRLEVEGGHLGCTFGLHLSF